MFTEAFTQIDSPIHRCNARARILAAAAWSIAVALTHTLEAQFVCGTVAIAAALAARLPLRDTLRRLLPLNVFIAGLFVLLPLTGDGYRHALGIGLRANAIVLVVTALVATLDIVAFGRALNTLRIPAKLITLLLFTVRYVAVLRREYASLRRAMRVRGFQPRTDAHTMRSFGYLAGMLLVRGMERSERVLLAMKCRGYTGKFAAAETAPFRARDAAFLSVALASIALVAWAELG